MIQWGCDVQTGLRIGSGYLPKLWLLAHQEPEFLVIDDSDSMRSRVFKGDVGNQTSD